MPVPTSIDDLDPVAANNSPEGSETVFPQLDNYLRAFASFIAQLRDQVQAAGVTVGEVSWWGGNRAAIPSTKLPLDGQIVTRAAYPELWAFVNGGGWPIISDASWLSNALSRASFSFGDGATTMRLPDLNGKAAASAGALVLRGDGALTTGSTGSVQLDTFKSHSHTASVTTNGNHGHSVSDPGHGHTYMWKAGTGGSTAGGDPNSVSNITAGTGVSATGIGIVAAGDHTHAITVDAVGDTETRVKAAIGAFVILAG